MSLLRRIKETPFGGVAARPARRSAAVSVHGGQPSRPGRVRCLRDRRARLGCARGAAHTVVHLDEHPLWRRRPWYSWSPSFSPHASWLTPWSAAFEAALYFYAPSPCSATCSPTMSSPRRTLCRRRDVHSGGVGFRLRFRHRSGCLTGQLHGRVDPEERAAGWSCCS